MNKLTQTKEAGHRGGSSRSAAKRTASAKNLSLGRAQRWPGDDVSRFWEKISANGAGCWEWLGGKNPDGYGRVRFGNRTESAHRVMFRLAFGTIPTGLQLDHLCRNPSCVNPYHLDPVTSRTNTLRGMARFAWSWRKIGKENI
jgi:hypothetical protein